jgi:hypothetical protein
VVGIYKITNLVNGKVYIGQSINIEKRWKTHKKDALWKDGLNYEYPLYRAIRKYGIKNFSFEIIEECAIDELNEREIFYIAKYDSYENGYNQTRGGTEKTYQRKLSEKEIDEIIYKLRTSTESIVSIAALYGVSEGTIRLVNNGESYVRNGEIYPIRKKHQKNSGGPKYTCVFCGKPVWNRGGICRECSNNLQRKVERPDLLELAKMVKDQGFERTGAKYNVSGTTIQKWFQKEGLPYRKKDIVNWYNQKVGVEPTQPKVRTPIEQIVRPVHQIDIITNKIIKTFSNATEAARSLNKEKGMHILSACKGKRKSAYGFNWAYADNT